MITENILMDAVKRGGNRQSLHEKIRILSMEAGKTVKEEGKENNLLELIAGEEEFGLSKEELECRMNPAYYTGRSEKQVEEYLQTCVYPVLEKNKDCIKTLTKIMC